MIGRPMRIDDLMDDLPDSQADTRPDAPGPIRVAHPASREAYVEALLAEVRALPATSLVVEHELELCSLLSTYRAWQHITPDPHVVLRTQRRLETIDVAVRSYQAGER